MYAFIPIQYLIKYFISSYSDFITSNIVNKNIVGLLLSVYRYSSPMSIYASIVTDVHKNSFVNLNLPWPSHESISNIKIGQQILRKNSKRH